MRFLLVFLVVFFASQPALVRAQDWSPHGECTEGRVIDGSKLEEPQDIPDLRKSNSGEPLVVEGGDFSLRNFRGLDLTNICFHRTLLTGTGWRGVTGENISFVATDLSHSNWLEFRGTDVLFRAAKLEKATFAGVDLTEVEFYHTSIAGSDFTGATLAHGSFRGTWFSNLQDANFTSANMTGFAFDCGIGQEDMCGSERAAVSFRKANLTNTVFKVPYISDWDFGDALIDNTSFALQHLTRLRDARIEGPVKLTPAVWNAAQSYHQARVPPPGAKALLGRRDLAAIFAASDTMERPGFDCAKASTKGERYICERRYAHAGSLMHAADDRALQKAYARALKASPEVRKTQIAWIAERDRCLDKTEEWDRDHCISKSYRDRIDALWAIAGQDHGMLRGQTRVYASDIEFLDHIEDERLRQKLALPALWNSYTITVVTFSGSGKLRAAGMTHGGNYHLGDLGSPAEGFSYDKASGFYGGMVECEAKSVFHPVLRFRGSILEPGEERTECGFNDYIMTGARASFSPMTLVPVSTETVRRHFPDTVARLEQ